MRDELTRLARERIEASVELQRRLLEPDRRALIVRVAVTMADALREGAKVLFVADGDSSTDARRLAAALVGRSRAALALHDAPERQVEALCRPHDVAVGISTSGNSADVIAALEAASRIGATTVGLTGADGGRMRGACDFCVRFPSDETPRIREGHTLIGHVLCEIVEDELTGS